MAFKNSKNGISQSSKNGVVKSDVQKDGSSNIIGRSYSHNRAFGKDITNTVLNNSGAATLNTTKASHGISGDKIR